MSTVPYERYNPHLHDLPPGLVQKKSKRPSYLKPEAIRKKVKPAHRRKGFTPRSFFTILIILLSVVLILELVFHLVISPRLRINTIQIDPGRGVEISEESVLQAAGISERVHYFDIDPVTIENRLLDVPFIRTVDVERRFPDTLIISIVQREALAAIIIDKDQTSAPALIDREGVLFRLGAANIEGLPVISGVRFENPRAGMVLPEVLIQFLEDIERIKETSPVLLTLISEFKFIKKDASRYEVLLYPEHYRIPVRIGDRLDERTLNYVMMVLDVVLRQGLTADVKEIDFRSGDVAFRTREG